MDELVNVIRKSFEWFEVKDCDMNNTAFFCILKPRKEGTELDSLKRCLRDTLLDVSDGLSVIGLPLPVIALIECDETKDKLDKTEKSDDKTEKDEIGDYDTWHMVAGDQEWHRGEFSIIPCKGIVEANEVFGQIKSPSFTAELNYEYKQITPKDFADYLEKEIKKTRIGDACETQLYEMLHKGLVEKLKSAYANDLSKAVNEALDSWEVEVLKVVEKANELKT